MRLSRKGSYSGLSEGSTRPCGSVGRQASGPLRNHVTHSAREFGINGAASTQAACDQQNARQFGEGIRTTSHDAIAIGSMWRLQGGTAICPVAFRSRGSDYNALPVPESLAIKALMNVRVEGVRLNGNIILLAISRFW